MSEINRGVYPTMITPYHDGEIDCDAVDRLVDWYADNGCRGIFAVCQSSEMTHLSLRERVKLARAVVRRTNGRMSVVASGHCADSLEAQAEEINAVSETGVDAVILVSNRLDLHNDGDRIWLRNAEKLLQKTNASIDFGLYECPTPYKRLLSDDILRWCVQTGRFRFIKDTCCNPEMLDNRLKLLHGTNCLLFNANAQTLLYSLCRGAAGYSGIMANFHPDLLAWLCDHYERDADKARLLSDVISMAAFTENAAYPCTAKYYLNLAGVRMETSARNTDEKCLNSYQKLVMEQLLELNRHLSHRIKE